MELIKGGKQYLDEIAKTIPENATAQKAAPEKKVVETKSDECAVEGCINTATHHLVVMLRTNLFHKAGATQPVCQVCSEHRTLTLDQICSDQSWNGLCAEIVLSGRKLPRRKLSYITPILIKK